MMSKKRSISSEDKALFRDAIKGIKPLKQDKHKTLGKSSEPSHVARRKAASQHPRSPEIWIEKTDPGDWLSAEDTLHFARSGLQHKLIQRLRRGQIQLEAHIDLHRQTVDEAAETVSEFIDNCVHAGKRWVCIIHGKGRFSKEGRPVLKNFLNQWLRQQPHVLAFHSAKPKHGGTGAIYVLLKGKSIR